MKVINKNIYCLGMTVQYNVEGQNVPVTFDSNGLADVDEAVVEHLLPYGIEKYEDGMSTFDIGSATNEELFTFLSSRGEEYLAGLAREAELPAHEWENKRKTSLAVYLYEKLKKPDAEETEPNGTAETPNKRGRPTKQQN